MGAAAKVIGEHELDGYGLALVAAFPRFAGAARDPGCKAKTGIVEALVRLGAAASDVFLQAVHIRQMEASFGPPVDTAAALRAHAVAGLAHANTASNSATARG